MTFPITQHKLNTIIKPRYVRSWTSHFLQDIYEDQKGFPCEPSHSDEHTESHDLHLDRCRMHQIPV